MKAKQFLESASAGATSSGSVASVSKGLGKVQKRSQKPGTNALDSDSLFGEAAPKGWEGTVKAMKKHKEIDNPWALAHHMKNKGYKSHKKEEGVAEGNNPEYDDEAGMADNNLETLERSVQGIDNLIQSGDNLPEWCQEKIAVAKSMLVTVWDYMYSEKERGAEVTEHKKGVRAVKYTTKPRNFVAKNAAATTSGAGAHKDKKKAAKQGDTKHKNKELTYESKLFTALETRLKK
jgi:hypothetical protein